MNRALDREGDEAKVLAPAAPAPPALRAESLRLSDGHGLVYGPLNLTVRPGEAALVLCPDLEIIRRLMRCCQTFDRPDSGRLSWWPGSKPRAGEKDWENYDFFRQIGYVDRQSQLRPEATVRDNLLLSHLYAGRDDGLNRVRRLLASLALTEHEDSPAEKLPEPLRRLTLYALALNLDPRLLLLERPARFLDRDFGPIWRLLQGRRAVQGLAVVIFDRSRADYAPDAFQTTAVLTPERPTGAGPTFPLEP